MFLKSTFLFFTLFSSIHCVANISKIKKQQSYNTMSSLLKDSVTMEVAIWLDKSRDRQIPIAIYSNRALGFSRAKKQGLVILNPGYPGKNTDYGYIAKNLASMGYLVVTIQNDLPTDPHIPTAGNIYKSRLPFWNTGVANNLYVIDKLKQRYPNLDFKQLTLIGHSNGGDISMLFATRYPVLVKTVISLDNRRMPFPRTSTPRIFSIRSMDQVADEDVIPSPEELTKYHITIVKVNTIHDDMGGMGTADQQKEINNYISTFLKKQK